MTEILEALIVTAGERPWGGAIEQSAVRDAVDYIFNRWSSGERMSIEQAEAILADAEDNR